MKRSLDPILIHNAQCDYRKATTRADRKKVVLEYAELAHCSERAIYRALKLGELGMTKHAKRSLSTVEMERISTVNEAATRIYDFRESHRRGEYKISLENAFAHFETHKMLPEGVSLRQIRRALTERLYLDQKGAHVHRRFQRPTPLEVVQADFSRSRRFELRTNREGSEVIHLRNPNYTRKEVKRLWFGCAIDDFSRVAFAKYYLIKGEGRIEWRNLILDVFEQKEQVDYTNGVVTGHSKLLQGIPEHLWTDNIGAMGEASNVEGLRFLGTKHIGGGQVNGDANKAARGKVERLVQSIKHGFEEKMLLEYREGYELSLIQLNEMLTAWLEKYNESPHPVKKNVTRWHLFNAVLASCDYPPEDAAQAFYKKMTKKVRNRLVNVLTDVWCKAPDFAKDGTEIPVYRVGDSWYTMHKGERYRLDVFTSFDVNFRPDKAAKKEEHPDEKLLGWLQIRPRLVQAIREASAGEYTLADLPDSFDDELERFCEDARTIAEIVAQGKYFVEKIQSGKQKKAMVIDTTGRLIA